MQFHRLRYAFKLKGLLHDFPNDCIFDKIRGMKNLVMSIFKLRKEMGLSFYLLDFIFRKIARQNAKVTWAIHHTSLIVFPENIKRGVNVYPGDSMGNYIQARNGIIIGDNTNIGPNVGLISSNHEVNDNTQFTVNKPISIGKDCWIGMGAVILPEVVLGNHTIVGANAVVTKSFPQGHCVIAGNPARLIKTLQLDTN